MRNWLRAWLGIEDAHLNVHDRALVEGANSLESRCNIIEQAIAANEAQRVADMAEIRERLDMPAKKKASGRPFQVLAKLAEMGARAQRMKDAG